MHNKNTMLCMTHECIIMCWANNNIIIVFNVVSEELLTTLDHKDELLNTMADISEDAKIKRFLCL